MMQRSIFALGLWLSLIASACAQGGMMPGPGMPAAAATTTWDPAHIGANITLSGGNLVATTTNATSARAIASHSTGKYYYSVVPGTSNNLTSVGICDSTYAVSASSLLTNLDCTGIALTSGAVFLNSGGIGSGGGGTAIGHTLDVAIDLGAQKLWYRVDGGGWFGNGGASPDPVTGTNGASFAGINAGPYFPAVSFNVGSTASVTACFNASICSNAPPTGYVSW